MRYIRDDSFWGIVSIFAVSVLGLSTASCGGSNPQPATPGSTSGSSTTAAASSNEPTAGSPNSFDSATTPSVTTTPTTGEQNATSSSPAPKDSAITSSSTDTAASAANLTDEQIAAITNAVNTSELEKATIAQKEARNSKVKKFARMMIRDHNEAKEKQNQLLKKLNIVPADNALSTQLSTEATSELASLKTKSGADFDRAYIDMQIKEHKTGLEMLDRKLLPSVSNRELKSNLEAMRSTIEQHLKEAQDLQKEVNNSSK